MSSVSANLLGFSVLLYFLQVTYHVTKLTVPVFGFTF
jgi:hypothetical protein